jgi:hypothetical protein
MSPNFSGSGASLAAPIAAAEVQPAGRKVSVVIQEAPPSTLPRTSQV